MRALLSSRSSGALRQLHVLLRCPHWLCMWMTHFMRLALMSAQFVHTDTTATCIAASAEGALGWLQAQDAGQAARRDGPDTVARN